MDLENLSCPSCGAPITWDQKQRGVRCKFCNHWLDVQHALCFNCGTLNQEGERFCSQCGSSIMRTCPACRHDNWGGAEHCANCGRILDLLEIMTQSRVRDTRARLQAQQREAFLIKQREAAESEVRMARFRAMERERQAELAQREAKQKEREQQMLIGIVIGAAAFVLVVIIVSILGAWLG